MIVLITIQPYWPLDESYPLFWCSSPLVRCWQQNGVTSFVHNKRSSSSYPIVAIFIVFSAYCIVEYSFSQGCSFSASIQSLRVCSSSRLSAYSLKYFQWSSWAEVILNHHPVVFINYFSMKNALHSLRVINSADNIDTLASYSYFHII